MEQTTAIEQFQNDVFRPIIKAQNTLLIAIFRDYCVRMKSNFEQFSEEDKHAYIERCIRRDQRFRSLLLGTIIGKLSAAEFELYCKHDTELSRRIISMLIQRLQSAVGN